MLIYSQTSGELRTSAGELIGVGFSGFENMRNTPKFDETLHGPIPKRLWDIYLPRRKRDSWEMLLQPQTPVWRTAHGQFSIGAGETSYGCINLPVEAVARVVELWEQGDRTLKVVL